MRPDPPLIRLMQGWLDGDIPDTEAKVLLRQLDADPQLRKNFAEQLYMLGALSAASEIDPPWLSIFAEIEHAAASPPHNNILESATMERIESSGKTRFWKTIPLFTPLAAASAIALAVFLKFDHTPSSTPSPRLSDSQIHPKSPHIAIVTGSQEKPGYSDGKFLSAGTISQSNRWLAPQTLSGVSITLTAPLEINLINPVRVFLKESQAKVFVPEGDEGFVMESPSFEVSLYLDGIQVAREAVYPVPINLDHLYNGRSDSPSCPPEFLERGLIGNIDEVAIFDRELSFEEIAIIAAGKSKS